MKRMTIPAFLVAAVLAFSLAGCSQSQSISADTLKGVWSLENSSDLGIEAYISFEDDDIVEMIIADSWLDGTYSVSNGSATVTFNSLYEEVEESDEGSSSSSSSSTKAAKLSYGNNKLTLGSNDGSKLVFVKDDSEEAKEMFSFDMSGLEGIEVEGEDLEYVDEVIEEIAPVTVADDDKVTITVTGKGTDFTGDPCYRLSITNKMNKAVYLVPKDTFTVGGQQVEAGLGDEVEAGQTLETDMYFATDELGGGLEKLTTVDGEIQVLDNETDDELATYTFHME